MRDQALITKFIDVDVAVNNEDANLTNIDSITHLNEYLIPIVRGVFIPLSFRSR